MSLLLGIIASSRGNIVPPLDTFGGASAAYSLRNLSSAYTGPLIRVRRSNDNVERDIYGTFAGDLDIASLVAFIGANSGFVTTWYDQSGSGRHATQASASLQPRIVNAGVVDTQNGKPAVWFDGVDDRFVSGVSLIATDNKIFFTAFAIRDVSTPTFHSIITAFEPTVGYGPLSVLGLGTNRLEVNNLQYGGSVVNNVLLLATINYYAGVQSSAIRKNGVNTGVGMRTNGLDQTSPSIIIGDFGGAPAQMNASEFIIYTTDRTSSISPIESNINNYYKIY